MFPKGRFDPPGLNFWQANHVNKVSQDIAFSINGPSQNIEILKQNDPLFKKFLIFKKKITNCPLYQRFFISFQGCIVAVTHSGMQ